MYIQFTKDINKIKNTVAFGLGWREIIIAVTTILSALAEYLLFKNILPSDLAFYPLIPTVLLGMFFIAYKKNGMKFEKVIFYKLKRVLFSKIKRYETEDKEVDNGTEKEKNKINKSEKTKKQSA